MIGADRRSLSQRLTRRMIVVQLITLATFFSLVLVPFFVLPAISGIRNYQPLDPGVIGTITRSLRFDPGSGLQLQQTPALTGLSVGHPQFWFMAVAADGREVRYGEIPKEAEALRPGLRDIVSMQVTMELESENSGLLVRTVTLPGGQVKVALGGGPTLGVSEFLQKFSLTLMLATFLVLAIASGVAIPRFIRKEMKGLNAAATAAGAIDIDQQGIRIPETDLPSEVLTLVHAVNNALERLDDAHSRRERFLADAAHELRTPIAIMSARIETAEPFEAQQRLLSDVTRLAELTNQLLDVQRLALSQPEFTPIDLTEMAQGVVGDLAPLAIAAGYELELDAPDRPIMISGDCGSLQRAITNIVRNAISHGGNRGRILVVVEAPGMITVTDDGPGIPESERDRIFEPFHRTTPSSEGAGLGLSLVEGILRRHEASIAVGSSPSGGAKFEITFAT